MGEVGRGFVCRQEDNNRRIEAPKTEATKRHAWAWASKALTAPAAKLYTVCVAYTVRDV